MNYETATPLYIGAKHDHAARRMHSTDLNIVGLAAGYHDSACCLLQNGSLTAAAQEERFSRIKNDRSFPVNAFRYCLKEAGITIADVDCISYYESPELKLSRQLWMGMRQGTSKPHRESLIRHLTAASPEQKITRCLGYEGRIEICEHHASHAASSFFFSGFDEAAILTVDGVGEWACTTYGSGQDANLDRFEEVDFPHSLGLFYSAITQYLGFEVNEGEYKVMGLAPYGQPRYMREMRKLIEIHPRGQYQLNINYFGFVGGDSMYSPELSGLFGRPPRIAESPIGQFHMDIAKSAQVFLEEILLEKVRFLHSQIPSNNLCMAGGVALNVVANSTILREGPFRQLFVQPAAGDAGGALGAAALAYVRLTGARPKKERLSHVYLGPAVSKADVVGFLSTSSASFRDCQSNNEDVIAATVERLIRGEVVGWVSGRMEFGPRSLGSRSILADPRVPGIRERVNQVIKMRESFRPFAPAVLESEAGKHFELDHPSPFMLETCKVRSSIPLPAITHIDGTARVQTVSRVTNPQFFELLQEFYRQTGCPMLLNTSFNIRGEPIVCSIYDAIICFTRSKLDSLILEDVIIDRSSIPDTWSLQALRESSALHHGSDVVSHLVYTFF
jgi:carbamoyltransferase